MLYEEFLSGTNNEERGSLESVQFAYDFINKIYMSDKPGLLKSKEDCYAYYNYHRTWFDRRQV